MRLIAECKKALAALSDEQEYKILFVATFVVCLFAAAGGRIFHLPHSADQASRNRVSLVAEAKAMVDSSLACAFMG